jgi:hypothetical protein
LRKFFSKIVRHTHKIDLKKIKMSKIQLSPQAKAAKAASQRKWMARNRERQHEYLRRYWEKKAQQEDVTVDNVTPVSVTSVTTCQECGKSFQPQRSTAKFCSDVCRVKYNRRHE